MKKLSTVLTGVALLGTLGLAFSSCTPTTDTPATTAAAPTAVMAMPLTATSMTIMWTRDVNDLSADTVIVTGSGATIAPVVVAAPGNTTPITGLTGGTVYTVSVHGTGGASASVTWAPPVRTMAVRIWELAAPSSMGYSGLQLASSTGAAVAVSFKNGTANTADFVLATDASVPSGLILESTDVFDSTYHVNALSDTAIFSPNGLDGLAISTDMSAFHYTSPGAETAINPEATYGTKGAKLKLVKTKSGHYAKLAIKPQGNGMLYGTSGGYKYIDVDVSYNTIATVPYAARPHGPTTRRSTPQMTQ